MSAQLWGKLPAHGDFVSRGIGPDERDELDSWLAGSLERAKTADDWEDRYDEAPPWRLAWTDGERWTAGALAPSADRVGRRYPILLTLTGLADAQVEHAADLVENLLYDALSDDWTADRLHAAAAALAPEASMAWAGGEGWWTLGAERFNEAWLVGARPADLMSAVLARATPAGGSLHA